MPEPTREELLKERESFNLREHLQSLKDAGENAIAVTEQEIRDFANELADKAAMEAARIRVGEDKIPSAEDLDAVAAEQAIAAATSTESEKPNAD